MKGRATLASAVVAIPLIFGSVGHAEAQRPAFARNVIYAEAFGNALFFGSINYERMLSPRLSLRVGASPVWLFPVMVNFLPAHGHHRAEAGLGVLLHVRGPEVSETLTLGYRYQPGNGGLVFRASWTPLVSTKGVATWGGVSLGFSF